MEIALELHLRNSYYDSFKEKEHDMQGEFSSFTEITNFSITRFSTRKTYWKPEMKSFKEKCIFHFWKQGI